MVMAKMMQSVVGVVVVDGVNEAERGRGGEGERERRERGAEEGGRCWGFQCSPSLVLSELGCRLLKRLVNSG